MKLFKGEINIKILSILSRRLDFTNYSFEFIFLFNLGDNDFFFSLRGTLVQVTRQPPVLLQIARSMVGTSGSDFFSMFTSRIGDSLWFRLSVCYYVSISISRHVLLTGDFNLTNMRSYKPIQYIVYWDYIKYIYGYFPRNQLYQLSIAGF